MRYIPLNIIISRTDNIGDMILALPMAKILKDKYPDMKVAMLGRQYTKPIALASEYVDAFIDIEDFYTKEIFINGKKPEAIVFLNPVNEVSKRAYELKIPVRVGTANRIYNWISCNYKVWLSRKRSALHEAQLNLKMLQPFNIKENFSLEVIANSFGLTKIQSLKKQYNSLITSDKFNVILHTKTQGHAKEWSINNFIKLIEMLDKNKYNIFISGTEIERPFIQPLLKKFGNTVTSIIGLFSLEQFIPFIKRCDAIVSNSTGPLHLAAAVGINALGIYSPIRNQHAGRWAPVGKKGQAFSLLPNVFCTKCEGSENFCVCINSIQPITIKTALDKLAKDKLL